MIKTEFIFSSLILLNNIKEGKERYVRLELLT